MNALLRCLRIMSLAAVLAGPAPLHGQQGGHPEVATIDSLVAAALVESRDEDREALLRQADSLAELRTFAEPADADALYWRAVTTGLLAEISGSREKIRLGTLSMEFAEAALAADSTHGGAHHVLGRIHAGVKRLGWFTRLIGGRLGMGPLLEAASWEKAEFHLRRARTLEPDNLTFRLEYGVALRDMGREREAAEELSELLTRSGQAPVETAALDRACRLLQELDAGPCPTR